jgi:hypothetical protein
LITRENIAATNVPKKPVRNRGYAKKTLPIVFLVFLKSISKIAILLEDPFLLQVRN